MARDFFIPLNSLKAHRKSISDSMRIISEKRAKMLERLATIAADPSRTPDWKAEESIRVRRGYTEAVAEHEKVVADFVTGAAVQKKHYSRDAFCARAAMKADPASRTALALSLDKQSPSRLQDSANEIIASGQAWQIAVLQDELDARQHLIPNHAKHLPKPLRLQLDDLIASVDLPEVTEAAEVLADIEMSAQQLVADSERATSRDKITLGLLEMEKQGVDSTRKMQDATAGANGDAADKA